MIRGNNTDQRKNFNGTIDFRSKVRNVFQISEFKDASKSEMRSLHAKYLNTTVHGPARQRLRLEDSMELNVRAYIRLGRA